MIPEVGFLTYLLFVSLLPVPVALGQIEMPIGPPQMPTQPAPQTGSVLSDCVCAAAA
jgi:hypothetical protein